VLGSHEWPEVSGGLRQVAYMPANGRVGLEVLRAVTRPPTPKRSMKLQLVQLGSHVAQNLVYDHMMIFSDPLCFHLLPEPKVVFAKEQQARSEVKAEAGASATMSCSMAQAQTEVTWFKDGKKLSSSSKVRVEASGCERRLVVQQAGKADAGEYSCESGGQKVSFLLDVTEPKVVFAKEQQAHSEVKAEMGASATLSCKVAQAQTEVTWFKDGKKLSSSSKVRVEASGCERRLV
ncbi:obscurin-like, partial [Sigmodon hispidus]